jgi:hypothetical protein
VRDTHHAIRSQGGADAGAIPEVVQEALRRHGPREGGANVPAGDRQREQLRRGTCSDGGCEPVAQRDHSRGELAQPPTEALAVLVEGPNVNIGGLRAEEREHSSVAQEGRIHRGD